MIHLTAAFLLGWEVVSANFSYDLTVPFPLDGCPTNCSMTNTQDLAAVNDCLMRLSQAPVRCDFSVEAFWESGFHEGGVSEFTETLHPGDPIIQAYEFPHYLSQHGLLLPGDWTFVVEHVFSLPGFFFDRVRRNCKISGYSALDGPLDGSEDFQVVELLSTVNATPLSEFLMYGKLEKPAQFIIFKIPSSCGVSRLTLLDSGLLYYHHRFDFSMTLQSTEAEGSVPEVECECPNEEKCPCPAVNILLRDKPLHMVLSVDNRSE